MIWIDGNVPSLKNSKVKGKNGIFASPTVKKYLQKVGVVKYSVRRQEVVDYKTRPNKFKEIEQVWNEMAQGKDKPLRVGFYFVRDSRRKFDFHNAVQILADLLVAHGFLEDDDMDCFIPVAMKMDGKYYHVDKEKPGVFIKIY